jgi:7,8-dihydropterin-6-yl-methyl-4-(beta-D-ribofuranosyl)aminobenzene 5'-phosphate synthase
MLADKGECQLESGLAVIVETPSEKFLLDTGNSDLFLKNSQTLGVNPDELDTIIITHGHGDHTNGLQYLSGDKRVIMHPLGFNRRYSLRQQKFVGTPLTQEEMSAKFDLVLMKEPLKVYDDVYFLGEIPRKFPEEENISTALDSDCKIKDPTLDDSGIAIVTEKGLVVMSGCGHAGIMNTCEYAKQVTGIDKIYAVFGGFHLVTPTMGAKTWEQLEPRVINTIKYMKEQNIEKFYLGHCVHEPVYSMFEAEFGKDKVVHLYAGGKFEI